jgi:hypothetical protein
MSLIVPENLDLSTMEVASVDLSQQYWTPEKVGEKRRMFFSCVQERIVLDQKTKEEVILPCAVFSYPTANGVRTVINGSKRLVKPFQENDIQENTPFEITYNGKVKNRTNGNMCDDWSIVMLKMPGGTK